MKNVLFTVHMRGSVEVVDESELRQIRCKVEFTKEDVSINSFEVEINGMADIHEKSTDRYNLGVSPDFSPN